ncbi:MAG: DUF3791 domain-containing protein [Lachnospiraceae bacterium]|nr:DUF3791 domain-containing protein [Lachnospiraceae bacterium]
MSKESDFFLYLIERYAEYKNISAKEVLEKWDQLKVTDLIYDLYEIYHSERLENAFADIDEIVEKADAQLQQ